MIGIRSGCEDACLSRVLIRSGPKLALTYDTLKILITNRYISVVGGVACRGICMSKIINFKTQENRKPDAQGKVNSQPDPREYSPDEVSDVIRHALKKVDSNTNDSVAHSELLSIAEEFGLGKSEIERAYEELLDERDMEQMKGYIKLQFKLTCIFVSFVAAILFGIDIFLVPDSSFVLYAIPGLIIPVLVGALNTKYLPKFLTNVFSSSSSVETGSSPSFTTRKMHISGWGFIYIYSGTHIEKGVLRIDGDSLLVEYRRVDSIFGVLKSKVIEVRIPLDELVSVELDRSYWVSKLTLRAKSLKTFEDVPGESDGYLKLTFTPRARVAVVNLARDIESYISDSETAAH